MTVPIFLDNLRTEIKLNDLVLVITNGEPGIRIGRFVKFYESLPNKTCILYIKFIYVCSTIVDRSSDRWYGDDDTNLFSTYGRMIVDRSSDRWYGDDDTNLFSTYGRMVDDDFVYINTSLLKLDEDDIKHRILLSKLKE